MNHSVNGIKMFWKKRAELATTSALGINFSAARKLTPSSCRSNRNKMGGNEKDQAKKKKKANRIDTAINLNAGAERTLALRKSRNTKTKLRHFVNSSSLSHPIQENGILG